MTTSSTATLTPAGPSVARRAAGGAGWVMITFGFTRVLSFATNLVLARLLSPSEFGVLSFAMVIIGAAYLLQDLGVSAAMIYGGRDIRQVSATALSINLAAGVLLFAATAAAAPLLATMGGDTQIGPIVVALGIGLVISAASSVPYTLLLKDLAFKRRMFLDTVPMVLSGAASVLLAVLGYGVWSLVGGYLVKATVSTCLAWRVASMWPRLGWNKSLAAELLRYGRHVSAGTIVGFALMNVDYLIVGNALGTAQLGIYMLAYMVATLPSTAVNQALSTVSFPALALVKDRPGALARLYADTLNATCVLAILAAIVLYVAVPPLAPVLLGEKWQGITGPLGPLVVFGVLRSIEYTFGPLYRAGGRPDMQWRLNALRLALLAPAMIFGVRLGVSAVAWVHVLSIGAFIPLHAVVIVRVLGIPTRVLSGIFAAHATGAAVAIGSILLVQQGPLAGALRAASAAGTEGAALAGLIVAAAAAYLATIMLLEPRVIALGRSGLAALPWPARPRPTGEARLGTAQG